MVKKNILTALCAGLAFACCPVFANDQGSAFVRVEGGRTDIKVEGESKNENVYSLRGGYNFNRSFGIEGFYTRYGRESYDLAVYDEEISLNAKLVGYGIGVFGKTNFGGEPYTGFFVTGRAGVVHNELKGHIAGIGSLSSTGTNLYVGVGAGYDFNRHFGISVNYDYQKPKLLETRFKLETLTLGLEYRF